ncbi:Gti1/Pac2 family-domain-containing protein [Cunninghamella echinulata]|nr:Gti1/Pac2 family-domain-containing protein [Cunninghamella echinulata]
MAETFHGYIDTTQDVLLVFEGCKRGLLPRISRRLQEKERKMIQSGSVFVFDEKESGVKRWTDGLVWSPSRILGNFLIYRELEKKNGDKRGSISSSQHYDHRQRSYSIDTASASSTISAAGGDFISDKAKEKRLVGSLSDVYNFRKDGLIKKTMSIVVNGSNQHLISYYHPQDILDKKLRSPSSVPELASLEISPELLVKQNFRIPPFIEPTFDQTTTTTTTINNDLTRQLPSHYSSPSTNGHTTNTTSSFRHMSVGSLNSFQHDSLIYNQQQSRQYNQHDPSNHPPYPSSSHYDNNNTSSSSSSSSSSTSLLTKPSPMYPSYYSQPQPQQPYNHTNEPSDSNNHNNNNNNNNNSNNSNNNNHSASTSSTSSIHSNSNSVYSSLPASTPSPNSIRYDPYDRQQQQQQRYPPSNHSQLGNLLNPIHPLNSPNSLPDSPPSRPNHHHHHLPSTTTPTKIESIDSIFSSFNNNNNNSNNNHRSSVLSSNTTTTTSRII